jgi:DNA-binding HxlR family transcriptional regulator
LLKKSGKDMVETPDFRTIQVANYPSRKLILHKLMGGPTMANELQRSVRMTQKVFDAHLKQLEDNKLVKVDGNKISITDKGKEILSYIEKLDQENIDWT